MIDTFHPQDPAEWAQLHFSGISLGDVRRSRRAKTIASTMAENPGQSIPQLFVQPYAVKAAYSFFDRPEATPQRLQGAHTELVLEHLREESGIYLLVEDASEISFSGLDKPIEGLGFISNAKEGLQGFLLHSVLAMRWQGIARNGDRPNGGEKRSAVEILGLASQSYRVREHEPRGRGAESSIVKKRRSRESEEWLISGARMDDAPCREDVLWVRVADRGADIYEFLRDCQKRGHGFVVRSAQDRGLVDPESGEARGRLFETARKAPSLGGFDLELRGRRGRQARTAHLEVSAVEVAVISPQRPGHSRGSQPPVRLRAVRVWEAEAPEGERPLEWILLTDREVEGFEAAREVAEWYTSRWLVEEFHKALKSGLGAERLQLEKAGRLFAAIALMSVVAVRLVEFRERVRLIPNAPAEQSGLGDLELKALRAYTGQPIRTVGEVGLSLGRMGGHMGRKADGMPGWITLWRGMGKLQSLVEGVRLVQQMGSFG